MSPVRGRLKTPRAMSVLNSTEISMVWNAFP